MLIMKQEDKEKFLACLQQRQFPRQALLFEYVLNKLYDALSQNQGVKNIPQTTAMHLFLYTCLGSRLADSAPEKNIFHYFPRWYACFRRNFENYARFIPTQDFVNCPLLSFWHTNAGYQKCNFKPWLTKTNAFNLELPEDYVPDEVPEIAFAEDEIGNLRESLDEAVAKMLEKVAAMPTDLFFNSRPFSTLGYLASLVIPAKYYPAAGRKGLMFSRTQDLPFADSRQVAEDVYWVMDTVMAMPEFLSLKPESIMTISELYQGFTDGVEKVIAQRNERFDNQIRENPMRIYAAQSRILADWRLISANRG